MVQLANFEKFRPQHEKATVKMEFEDPLEEEHGPLDKKPKWGEGSGTASPESAQCSLLDEPSPLGLRLRKSPSLLDLIQMRLSQGNSATSSNGVLEAGKKELKSTALSGATDKLKASNFPAALLRIGSWECVSRYEGDLVAKCYYAKHKLVWEVLDGGLKSKIEIQWSDITALKATCPENAPGTLDIVLARQPLFFRETNPQPRKHTLWQATSDFTNGQASIHRRHCLHSPPGLLTKHFEKLIQCDPRLNSLSRQPEIIQESSYFEQRSSVFEDHDESKCHGFDDLKDGFGTVPGFQDHVSACATPTYVKSETRIPIGRSPGNVPRETLSPSSVIDARVIEENPTTSGTKELLNDSSTWDQIKVPGLRSSMSMSDLVNHIGHCISGQTTPGNPLLPTDSSVNNSVLEELTQYLLGDSQVNSASDEQSLMSRVNSLCCLIQHKNPSADDDDVDDEDADAPDNAEQEVETKPSMSRKESYGELLMHLPRIASMPFLFNITEDSENQAR